MPIETIREIDAANFLYFCAHLDVHFESFDDGWITYATQPHLHTGRVFKVKTNCQNVKFTRDSSIPMGSFYFEDGFDSGYTTWGEIYGRNGDLTDSTSVCMTLFGQS